MALWIGLSNHPQTHTHTHPAAAQHHRQTERKTQIRFYIFNCQSSSQFPCPLLPVSLFPSSLCRCWNYNQSLLASPLLRTSLSSAGLVLRSAFYFISAQINLLFPSFLDFPHENSKVKIPLAAATKKCALMPFSLDWQTGWGRRDAGTTVSSLLFVAFWCFRARTDAPQSTPCNLLHTLRRYICQISFGRPEIKLKLNLISIRSE